MATHELKTNQSFIPFIYSGAKTFEIRLNDRDFKVGNIYILKRWDPIKKKYTGDQIKILITYIPNHDFSGIHPDYIVFSFKVTMSNYERIPEN